MIRESCLYFCNRGSHYCNGHLKSRRQKACLPSVFGEVIPETRCQEPLFPLRLHKIIRSQQKKRDQTAPLPNRQCRPRNREQHARINRMSQIRVWPTPNQLMIYLQRHLVAPILAECPPCPDAQQQSSRSERHTYCPRNRAVRQKSSTKPAHTKPWRKQKDKCDAEESPNEERGTKPIRLLPSSWLHARR
jgi:hypothetical protein